MKFNTYINKLLNKIKPKDTSVNQNSNTVILWDRVIIAVSILTIVLIGCISMIVYFASGNKASKKLENLSDKKVQSSTFGKEIQQQPVVDEEEIKPSIKVFIDAGHGGEDGGSTSFDGNRIEKDDNLKLSLAVKAELEKLGVEVIISRTTDEFVSLDDRCSMANESNADLFVSLHRNSAYSGQGVEIWVSNKEIPEDTLLGQNIMDALDKAGISQNRGVQFGYIGNPTYNYQVNYDTQMPSCLVELGFITNDEDNKLYDENFDSYAEAISSAIYKTALEIKE